MVGVHATQWVLSKVWVRLTPPAVLFSPTVAFDINNSWLGNKNGICVYVKLILFFIFIVFLGVIGNVLTGDPRPPQEERSSHSCPANPLLGSEWHLLSKYCINTESPTHWGPGCCWQRSRERPRVRLCSVCYHQPQTVRDNSQKPCQAREKPRICRDSCSLNIFDVDEMVAKQVCGGVMEQAVKHLSTVQTWTKFFGHAECHFKATLQDQQQQRAQVCSRRGCFWWSISCHFLFFHFLAVFA